jgi:hypothetical protein
MTLRKISGTKDEDVSGLLKVLKKIQLFVEKETWEAIICWSYSSDT